MNTWAYRDDVSSVLPLRWTNSILKALAALELGFVKHLKVQTPRGGAAPHRMKTPLDVGRS